MLLGSAAGGITAFFTTPLDVVKTRIMLQSANNITKYNGLITIIIIYIIH